jgi:hypothetical protein
LVNSLTGKRSTESGEPPPKQPTTDDKPPVPMFFLNDPPPGEPSNEVQPIVTGITRLTFSSGKQAMSGFTPEKVTNDDNNAINSEALKDVKQRLFKGDELEPVVKPEAGLTPSRSKADLSRNMSSTNLANAK